MALEATLKALGTSLKSATAMAVKAEVKGMAKAFRSFADPLVVYAGSVRGSAGGVAVTAALRELGVAVGGLKGVEGGLGASFGV